MFNPEARNFQAMWNYSFSSKFKFVFENRKKQNSLPSPIKNNQGEGHFLSCSPPTRSGSDIPVLVARLASILSVRRTTDTHTRTPIVIVSPWTYERNTWPKSYVTELIILTCKPCVGVKRYRFLKTTNIRCFPKPHYRDLSVFVVLSIAKSRSNMYNPTIIVSSVLGEGY